MRSAEQIRWQLVNLRWHLRLAGREARELQRGKGLVVTRSQAVIPRVFRPETIAHYRETIDNYRYWSREGNLHFGYWQWGMNPFDRERMLQRMNDVVLDALEVAGRHGTVLDLGCGVGALSRAGASRFPNVKWRAANISSEQIELAKSCSRSANIRFVLEDYHRLSMVDEAAIGACFVESLCYSTAPELALAEAARTLEPGSRIVIADGFLKRPIENDSVWFRWLHDAVAGNWAVPGYHEIQRYSCLGLDVGLKLVECRELSWRIAMCALHSVPLTLWCMVWLLIQRRANRMQWRHLVACGCSLLLGLHRSRFGYYLLVFEKVDTASDQIASDPIAVDHAKGDQVTDHYDTVLAIADNAPA